MVTNISQNLNYFLDAAYLTGFDEITDGKGNATKKGLEEDCVGQQARVQTLCQRYHGQVLRDVP